MKKKKTKLLQKIVSASIYLHPQIYSEKIEHLIK